MDKILENLKQLAKGIAMQFGESCEVVIHDINPQRMEASIVHVENGELSNRKVGDGPSHIVLETMKKAQDINLNDRYTYLTRNKNGKIFRSSTMYIRDENNCIAYVFCINFDITDFLLLQSTVNKITGGDLLSEGTMKSSELITTNVADLLDDLLLQAEKIVGKPAILMDKTERLEAIRYLNDMGAFLITKSSEKIMQHFNISKFTLYSDLNTIKEDDN